MACRVTGSQYKGAAAATTTTITVTVQDHVPAEIAAAVIPSAITSTSLLLPPS